MSFIIYSVPLRPCYILDRGRRSECYYEYHWTLICDVLQSRVHNNDITKWARCSLINCHVRVLLWLAIARSSESPAILERGSWSYAVLTGLGKLYKCKLLLASILNCCFQITSPTWKFSQPSGMIVDSAVESAISCLGHFPQSLVTLYKIVCTTLW